VALDQARLLHGGEHDAGRGGVRPLRPRHLIDGRITEGRQQLQRARALGRDRTAAGAGGGRGGPGGPAAPARVRGRPVDDRDPEALRLAAEFRAEPWGRVERHPAGPGRARGGRQAQAQGALGLGREYDADREGQGLRGAAAGRGARQQQSLRRRRQVPLGQDLPGARRLQPGQPAPGGGLLDLPGQIQHREQYIRLARRDALLGKQRGQAPLPGGGQGHRHEGLAAGGDRHGVQQAPGRQRPQGPLHGRQPPAGLPGDLVGAGQSEPAEQPEDVIVPRRGAGRLGFRPRLQPSEFCGTHRSALLPSGYRRGSGRPAGWPPQTASVRTSSAVPSLGLGWSSRTTSPLPRPRPHRQGGMEAARRGRPPRPAPGPARGRLRRGAPP